MKNLIIILALIPTTLFAQENLLDELNSQSKETDYAFATFKSTRLGNGHTVETRSKNTLDFFFNTDLDPLRMVPTICSD